MSTINTNTFFGAFLSITCSEGEYSENQASIPGLDKRNIAMNHFEWRREENITKIIYLENIFFVSERLSRVVFN